MLTIEQAERAALALAKAERGYAPDDPTLVILDRQTRETAHGWFFIYNTRDYAATGDPLLGLMGNGPIGVPKDGSPPESFASAYSLDRAATMWEAGR